MPNRLHILVVEDSKADVFLIREAIEATQLDAELQIVPDGEKAIRFFKQADLDPSIPCPALILLDLNLPRQGGGEVLRQIRGSRRCANVLVLVVTSSDSNRDREEMSNLGVNGYFRKPSEHVEFMKLGQVVREILGRSAG